MNKVQEYINQQLIKVLAESGFVPTFKGISFNLHNKGTFTAEGLQHLEKIYGQFLDVINVTERAYNNENLVHIKGGK